jgi:hypothetical protein
MKKREKILTLEEIKQKMLDTTASLWSHSTPLLSLIRFTDGPKLTPLSPEPYNQIFLVFLLDVANYHYEIVLDWIGDLKKKYRNLPWTPILAIQPNYLFVRNPKFIERLNLHPVFQSSPVFLDSTGEWFEFFKAQNSSTVLMIEKGITVVSERLFPNLSQQSKTIETLFQKILRNEDPGLPLLLAQMHSSKRPADTKIYQSSDYILSGQWISAGQAVVSEDSNATLSISIQTTHLRLIASPHPNARENTKFQLFLDNDPLPPNFFGTHVKPGEKNIAQSEINRAIGITELIRSDQPVQGTLKLKFMNAVENPMLIYGFHAGAILDSV